MVSTLLVTSKTLLTVCQSPSHPQNACRRYVIMVAMLPYRHQPENSANSLKKHFSSEKIHHLPKQRLPADNSAVPKNYAVP